MMTNTPRKRYQTAQYSATLEARGSLTVWLDKQMARHGRPNGKRGRDQSYSDAAIQFCLTIIKNLFVQPSR